MKADALWIVEPNKMEIRPFEVNEPKFDEVLFKTMAGGVCCWDAYLYQGFSAPGPLHRKSWERSKEFKTG
jgi:Zn-dependent alcohol dehydrogenase